MSKIILLNKPFQVMCQFTDKDKRQTLADFFTRDGFYPAGRLDYDSEGLVILTDDGQLQHLISHPDKKQIKTYYAQVEGAIDQSAVSQLQRGVQLKDGVTKPAKATCVVTPGWLWNRNPPIRQRDSIPTSWLKLAITEGKNRQVRRMTAAVGFPTLRLIRYSIGSWSLQGLLPGEYREDVIYLPRMSRR